MGFEQGLSKEQKDFFDAEGGGESVTKFMW